MRETERGTEEACGRLARDGRSAHDGRRGRLLCVEAREAAGMLGTSQRAVAITPKRFRARQKGTGMVGRYEVRDPVARRIGSAEKLSSNVGGELEYVGVKTRAPAGRAAVACAEVVFRLSAVAASRGVLA